jgi:uncharacterized phiE125 gp8 family phage protein
MRFRLVTDATVEPVSVADLMAFIKVDLDPNDGVLLSLIKAARRTVERVTSISLIDQNFVAVCDSSETTTNEIKINKRPFKTITQIQSRSVEGSLSVVDASSYYLEVSDYYSRVIKKGGLNWGASEIEISFTCGFGASSSFVPDDLILCVKMLAAHWHEHREPVIEGNISQIPLHVQSILSSWHPLRLI